MKLTNKLILTLLLVILLLCSCFTLVITGFSAFWLQTYNALTSETLVADVTISALKKDERGQYADVSVQYINHDSALNHLVGNNNVETKTSAVKYKLYGDTIYMGGPIIKFKDQLIVLNFQSMYKLGKIYARYDLDNDLEINRNSSIASTYDINGGYTDWKSFYDTFSSDEVMGKIIRVFVDSTQVSTAGAFVTNKEQHLNLYVRNTGFIWKTVERN